jgi:hypothetical protein
MDSRFPGMGKSWTRVIFECSKRDATSKSTSPRKAEEERRRRKKKKKNNKKKNKKKSRMMMKKTMMKPTENLDMINMAKRRRISFQQSAI